MKLRNKKTGEIVVFGEGIVDLKRIGCANVAEMIEAGWEDYKEPEAYWYINDLDGEPMKCDFRNCGKQNFTRWGEHRKQIGNYFETEEEAKKAVEKLKAWKRLKDKGVEFYGWRRNHTGTYDILVRWEDRIPRSYEVKKDLDLLFGGEE